MTSLANALDPVAGSGPIIFVMGPGRAGMSGMRTGRYDGGILGSAAVGNDVIAIAPAGIAAALSPDPAIETSNAGTLVMDTAPGAMGTMGPARSLFQTDAIGIKMRWPVTWIRRTNAAVAWLTPTWK